MKTPVTQCEGIVIIARYSHPSACKHHVRHHNDDHIQPEFVMTFISHSSFKRTGSYTNIKLQKQFSNSTEQEIQINNIDQLLFDAFRHSLVH